jgi:hypothetical protein
MPSRRHWVNLPVIRECLHELNDRVEQVRLWLSTGGEVSSFDEAVAGLFDDSGLSHELERGTTGLGAPAEQALRALDDALRRVHSSGPVDVLIDSPEMDEVRRRASAALALVEAHR